MKEKKGGGKGEMDGGSLSQVLHEGHQSAVVNLWEILDLFC